HKFDPITQEDYYSLQAVFAAIDRDDREYSPDPAIQKQLVELKRRIRDLQQYRDQLPKQLAEQGGDELVQIDKRIAEAGRGASSAQGGYHSQIEASPSAIKWVQIDLGSPQDIRNVVLHPCYDDFNSIGAGFGFPLRYRIEVADDPEFRSGVTLVSDQTASEVPNPGVAVKNHPTEVKAQNVRVTATQLVPRANDYIFALAEVEVLSPSGENLAQGKTVSSLDSIEAPTRWTRSNAVDGLSPARASTDPEPLKAERNELLAAKGLSALSDELAKTANDLTATEAERKSLQPIAKVYAATTHKRSGQPRTIHLLARGNVLTPMQEVSPGTLGLLEMLPSRFDLPADHSEGDRRVALAKWLSDPSNPLTWRSIVNRVWQYHFGQGIVATPNDFGLNGSLPSHPELLDWLAIGFRDQGGSLKALHKLIL
ncbi:MAG: DUF1553 domain-containing protein, partial [Planctomycetota bacterium]